MIMNWSVSIHHAYGVSKQTGKADFHDEDPETVMHIKMANGVHV